MKSYVVNTAIGGVFFGLLALITGREITSEDVIAFFMLGWMVGWLFNGIFKAFIVTGKDAKQTVEALKEGKDA